MFVPPSVYLKQCNYCLLEFNVELDKMHVCPQCYKYLVKMYTVGGKPCNLDADGCIKPFHTDNVEPNMQRTFPQTLFIGHDDVKTTGPIDRENPCNECHGIRGMVYDEKSHTCFRCFFRNGALYNTGAYSRSLNNGWVNPCYYDHLKTSDELNKSTSVLPIE